jgi:hypothetical protein
MVLKSLLLIARGISDLKSFPLITAAFQDYDGNTLFVGNGARFKAKPGSIIATVLTLPFLYVPYLISLGGYKKFRYENGIIIKKDQKGTLSLSAVIDYESVKFRSTKSFFVSQSINGLSFSAKNNSAKTNYVGFDDKSSYFIYSTAKNKVIKTIAKNPNSSTNVTIGRAKEGHIMLIETNSKARTTTLNIESLEN